MKTIPSWRLLIAEDSLSLQASLVDSLFGLKQIAPIHQSFDVPQTLTAIRQFEPDLVLLDLRMPGGDSFAVLDALRTKALGPVVLVFSMEDSATVRERCLELGAHGFFSKSSDSEVLRRVLAGLSRNDLMAIRKGKKSAASIFAGKPARLAPKKPKPQSRPAPLESVCALEALHESERRYQYLFEQNPLPMLVYHEESLRLIAVNSAACLHYGYTEKEFLALTIKDIRPQEDVAALLDYFTQEDPLPIRTWRHCRKDGTPLLSEVTSHSMIFAGQPARLSLINDVTERIRVEAAARAAARQVSELINSVEGIVWEADAQTFQFTFVSKQAETLLGYPLERWTEQGFWKAILHPEDRDETIRCCLDATRRGQDHQMEYRMIAADGRVIWFKDIVTVVSDQEVPVSIRGLLVDITASKTAEAALHESEILFRELANAMPQIVWASQPDGTLNFVNERALKQARVQDGGIGPVPWPELLHPEDAKSAIQRWKSSLLTGASYETQFRLRGLDGNYRWHLARALPARDDSGEIIRWFGTCTDVHDQLRVQDELAHAQKVARMGSWSLDLRTKRRTWSAEIYRLLGFENPLFEPDGETFFQRLHPDDRARFCVDRDHALQHAANYEAIYRIVRPDGAERSLKFHVAMEKNAHGELIRAHGVMQDVTRERAAEQHLREQVNLLNLSRDAITVRDLGDCVRFWNRGAEKIYGWKSAEVLGRSVLDFVFAEEEQFLQAKETLLAKGEWSGPLRQIRKDGSSLIVESRWTLLRDEDEKPESVLVVNTDITERTKLEEQLHRVRRLESIGTLASGVAHDLNNVLVPILMIVPLLRGETAAEDREKFLDLIQMSAERGAGIVKQVVTFARGADGDRILLQPVYLLQEMAKIAENTFPKQITVRTRYHENVNTLEADPSQLHQVLLNLAVNARDAMPEGGTLTLAADNFDVDETMAAGFPGARSGPHVLLQVSDTGSGIPAEVKEKIFEPFFTTKEIGVGTGLGLSTVLGIVKGYGGLIQVESEPGSSTFKVYLPAAVAKPSGPSNAASLLDRGQTVLLVDDEASIRNVTRSTLVRHDYPTLVAANGKEAIALFARHSRQIAVVVTDIGLPGMDGLTLARTLRTMKPEVKIILTSGRGTESTEAEVETLAVDACIAKPFTQASLIQTLEHVLSSPNL